MSASINTLCKELSVGVYVVGVAQQAHLHAFTAAWVMQVSFNPPLLALSINPHHYSYSLLAAGRKCSVNVLGQQQLAIAEHFGRAHSGNKMAGFRWQTAVTGAPILSDCLTYFDCTVSHFTDAGDHQLAICEIIAAQRLSTERPLLYHETSTMDKAHTLYPSSLT